MDNHYHLLIRTHKNTISDIMFNLNNVIAKFINTKLERTGHVLEKRYFYKIVDTESYLFWVLRYIHRNPIRANICININGYPWSSHYFYKKGINNFVNTNFILNMLNEEDKNKAIETYLELVDTKGNDLNPLEDFKIISNMMGFNEKPLLWESDISDTFIKPSQKTLDEIRKILYITDELLNEIKGGCRKQNIINAKIAFIKYALKEKYSLKEIASFLNQTPSSISKIINRKNIK